MSTLGSETSSDFKEAIQRATFGHPFLLNFEFTTSDEKDLVVSFDLARPINDVLLRKFGEDLYQSLREAGYLVNVTVADQTKNKISFTFDYSGVKLK